MGGYILPVAVLVASRTPEPFRQCIVALGLAWGLPEFPEGQPRLFVRGKWRELAARVRVTGGRPAAGWHDELWGRDFCPGKQIVEIRTQVAVRRGWGWA